ncbi:TPR repeat region-containing protein [Glycomyces rhizosphaerae]|uniref:TPR repeat domain-containing protein n=1 Tax=Glycomyces rhizosphaerae TaxID=2054422 RepID=A0ABV7PVP4_9ACTN
MAAIPTLGSFDPPTTTANEDALEDAARSLDNHSGRILGQGTDVVAKMNTTAVEFSELVSEPIKQRGGEFLTAATAAMEGAVWGSAVTNRWAASVREFKAAVKKLNREWAEAVNDKFGIRESQVGGTTPNLTPAEREAATADATAYAGGLKLAEMNDAANAAYEKFKGDAADAGGMLKEGPTPENLRAMATGGGVDSWALFSVFGMNAPMPLTGDWGGVLGDDLLDALKNGRVEDLPPELRGQLGVLKALIERAHHLDSIGEGKLSAGELEYLERFFGAIDKSVFNMPDLLDDTYWTDADKALVLAGMGGGLLAVSNDKLGGGTGRLPDSVRNFVDAYIGGKGKGSDLKPQHHDGDELRALATMFDAIDYQGMAYMRGGKDFSAALTIAVSEHLDGEAGGFSIGEGTARTILDHSLANTDANAAILTGDLQHPYYKEHTAESVLRGLFGHQWEDDGKTAAKLIDWIPDAAVGKDEELAKSATESFAAMFGIMTDEKPVGPWDESGYEFFSDHFGEIGDYEAAPIGAANPAVAQAMGRSAIAFLDAFAASPVKETGVDWGGEAPLDLETGSRVRFLELVMGDEQARDDLAQAAYAHMYLETGGMPGWADGAEAGEHARTSGRLLGYVDAAFRAAQADAGEDAAGQTADANRQAAWMAAGFTIAKEIALEVPGASALHSGWKVVVNEGFELGKWGPGVARAENIVWKDGTAPYDEGVTRSLDDIKMEVGYSIVDGMTRDPKSGIDIGDVRQVEPQLVAGPKDAQDLRSVKDLLLANDPDLGDRRVSQDRVITGLERLIERDPELFQRYKDFIQDIEQQRKDVSQGQTE